MPFDDLPKISFVRTKTGGIKAYVGEYQAEEGDTVRVAAVPLATAAEKAAWEMLRKLDEITTHAEIAEVLCAVAIAGYEYGRTELRPPPETMPLKERRKRK